MCHTNHGTKEKKVVIRYLLQASFPLTKRTLSNFIVFDINLCRSTPPQPDNHSPLPHRALGSRIIQVCRLHKGEDKHAVLPSSDLRQQWANLVLLMYYGVIPCESFPVAVYYCKGQYFRGVCSVSVIRSEAVIVAARSRACRFLAARILEPQV